MQCLTGSPLLISFFFVDGLELLVAPFLFGMTIFLLVVPMVLGLHVSSSESSLSSSASSSVSSSTSSEKLFFVETGIHVTNSADKLENSSSSESSYVLKDSSSDELEDSSSFMLVHSNYMKVLSGFMKCTEDHRERMRETKILCPCKECRNIVSLADPNMIRRHLIEHDFNKNYTCWDLHDETRESQVDSQTFVSDINHEENDSNDDNHHDNLDEMLYDVESNVDEKNVKKLQQLFVNAKKPLYNGCKKFTKISLVVKLLDLKAKNNWSDKSFTTLLELKDYKDLHECPICMKSRYKHKNLTELDSDVTKNGPPAKLLNELAPQVTNGTKMYLPPACYTLSKAEKTSFCECLHGVKVPSDYFANIKNLVSMKDLKFLGMKSYDFHVLLTQMIPIAIHGVMPPPVRQTITKLCLFFNMIHLKVIDHEKLDELQHDIIIILCQFKMYFPPSFFNAMVHPMSHIVEEIKLDGPVFLRIVQGYAAKEVVRFCTNCIDDVADISLPQPRHQENNSHRDQRWLEAEHKRTFSQWLADKVIRMSPTNVDADVIQLRYRPCRVLQYQGYDINRYTFYTKQQDGKSTMQNSGVTLIATTTDSSRMIIAKNSCYGVIKDIWELDYTSFVIPQLKCKWINNTRGVKFDSDGFTCVNLSTNGYLSDLFILAKQATQVFYVEEPKDKRWHIILQSKQSIVGVDDVVDEDEYNKFDELPHFSIGVQSMNDVFSDTLYLRSDHQEGHED
uniref:Transposase n=1 Tax=Tanacetum cinerariifolium TaxID=118510 RepID=A0A699HQU9_TANCI|nr:hypothetical protein [Tanacetum cinerariifolium]